MTLRATSRGEAIREGTRRRKAIAAMSEQIEAALDEFSRMVIAGEIDFDKCIRDEQDVFVEAAITPKGMRELGYGDA